MTKPLCAGVALSAFAFALALTGCASTGSNGATAGGIAGKVEDSYIALALKAQQALQAKDYATATAMAERLVEKSPTDAGFRTLLGNAYLAAGRFASAEAAFRDSLSLLPGQAGVPLKLVLTQIGQGRSDAALATLEQFRGGIEAADAGLATALAGQPGNAVAMLDEAARREGADARVRQNLALAYALAGDWNSARTVSAQDLPPDQIDARIAEWMSFAKPAQAGQQVAALIGVTPAASDPGQPARLALARAETHLAEAAPASPAAPVEAVAPHAVAVSAAAPVYAPAAPPVAEAHVSFTPDVGEAAPALAAVEQPLPMPVEPAQVLREIRREPVRVSGALPKPQQLRRAAAARFATGSSKAVVQLGAYGSPARVAAAWSAVSKRHVSLRRFTPASARFGSVYRLSLKGFASDREARLLCESLKRAGSSCFVRSVAGDTAVRFASR
ncbi:tetratricopeptide repeat protein [Sphingomonas sp. GCM10030256]|uniref:SPOR domain-containing protein n=1 Tax=Sphingomonas sp. GCM10030256 TaxID=3273427 RepID=UPI00360C42DA